MYNQKFIVKNIFYFLKKEIENSVYLIFYISYVARHLTALVNAFLDCMQYVYIHFKMKFMTNFSFQCVYPSFTTI